MNVSRPLKSFSDTCLCSQTTVGRLERVMVTSGSMGVHVFGVTEKLFERGKSTEKLIIYRCIMQIQTCQTGMIAIVRSELSGWYGNKRRNFKNQRVRLRSWHHCLAIFRGVPRITYIMSNRLLQGKPRKRLSKTYRQRRAGSWHWLHSRPWHQCM